MFKLDDLSGDMHLQAQVLKNRWLYSNLFRRFGPRPEALHWNSRESQDIRFGVLAKIGSLDGMSILDIGCGLGDFFGYLKAHGVSCAMTGIDIVAPLVAHVRKTYPEAKIYQKNILTDPFSADSYDYVFSSGLYAFGNRPFFEAMLCEAFRICRKGYAFNILECSDSRFFKISRDDMLGVCRDMKPSRMEVQEGYLDDDVSVFLTK